ncbi:uncharacterized protein [Blastocystis hominis]|uniref:Inward rectifier potassium channel C-terminal domain-containing protein n=1 Tax=Blastocystis hominis TaxID=12968 RepID=D8M7K3_BLAHO|nr:uncharacterized protein [Blastocystis hominis]CBK24042.2 unnamed protein product [Blastocystis hominis]|eukprot:XP_012898090.1 uncharacterized protein [Blastocystis hominis]
MIVQFRKSLRPEKWTAESQHISVKPTPELTGQLILDTIRRRDLEIVVLVEGTESVTSSTLQARFSYAAEDIVVNRMFSCVTVAENGEAVIDFEKFHQTMPIDPDDESKEDLFIQSVL